MKKLASFFKFSAGFLAVLVLVGLFGRAPVQANAWTVQRNDGTWLWPLKDNVNCVTDWAGCRIGKCYFQCGVTHGCDADTHTTEFGHAGIDLGKNVVGGQTPVYAAAAGEVVACDGSSGARGNTVLIEHKYENGYSYYSYYEHLYSFTVTKGQIVSAGTQIGVLGNTGNSTGAHLHFSIVFGASDTINSIGEIPKYENLTWLKTDGFGPGRILVNPAVTNTLPIADLGSKNLSRHPGSVNYTSDPSKVKIGMSGTSGAVVSANSPWRYSGTPQNILWQNMVNDEVKWLQQALNVTMNAGLAVDGSFGPTTRAVLIEYQLKHGIGSDGMFGPESNAHMLNQLKILGYLSDGTYHEHAFTKYVSNGDETHTAQCKVCEYADAEHTGIACSGGTATSTTPATCEYCGGTYGDVLEETKDKVTLNGKEIKDWKVGQEGQFKVYVNGVRVDRDTMIWSSSNPSVATCVNGYLVGKSAGTTVISCTKKNGTTAICKVTVIGGEDIVTLNGKEIKDWKVGQEGQFKVYVNGEKVARDTMTWSSSNPSVATCVNGYLVGKSAGFTLISCTKANGTTATCKVTVIGGEDAVTLNTSEIKNWEVGKEGPFKVYVNGVQVDRTTMTWNSSNPSVATCVNGKLVGKSAGTALISCTKENGTTATCKVTVVGGKDVVTLNSSEIKNWEVGKEGPFKAYVNGVQVDRTTMTWSSSDESVATCVNGKLVGKSAGTVTITCTKANGTTATCKVTVVGGKDVVTLSSSEIKNWEVGKEGPFKVYVNGVQVDRTTMIWSSSNTAVATCVNGKLVGKSAGTVTISCTKANGTTATCKVTVK